MKNIKNVMEDHLYNYYRNAKVFLKKININIFRTYTTNISILLQIIHFRNKFEAVEKSSQMPQWWIKGLHF